MDEWKYLDNFLRRFNKVFLERTALANERARLEDENAELKGILKQYLDSLSITQVRSLRISRLFSFSSIFFFFPFFCFLQSF